MLDYRLVSDLLAMVSIMIIILYGTVGRGFFEMRQTKKSDVKQAEMELNKNVT